MTRSTLAVTKSSYSKMKFSLKTASPVPSLWRCHHLPAKNLVLAHAVPARLKFDRDNQSQYAGVARSVVTFHANKEKVLEPGSLRFPPPEISRPFWVRKL